MTLVNKSPRLGDARNVVTVSRLAMPLCYRLVEIGLSLFIGGGEGNPALDPEQLRANPTAFAVLFGVDVPQTGSANRYLRTEV